MNRGEFKAYLQQQKSRTTGQPFSAKVINDVVSRCATIERKFKIDLDDLVPVSLDVLRSKKQGGYLELIPYELRHDYLTALRKYIDYVIYDRRCSSQSSR